MKTYNQNNSTKVKNINIAKEQKKIKLTMAPSPRKIGRAHV